MILLQLTASTGPEECCLAVRKALSVVLRECAEQSVSAEVLEQLPGSQAGTFRSVLLALDGAEAHGVAHSWRGSVQWICPSPYRPGHKRKNWFIGVEVFEPQACGEAHGELREQDLRFETLRASGPGGQHVNKTDSAVRLTHLPIGLSVKVQTEGSQHANKRLARALLAHKLAGQATDMAQAARAERWLQHYSVERGGAGRVFKGESFMEVR